MATPMAHWSTCFSNGKLLVQALGIPLYTIKNPKAHFYIFTGFTDFFLWRGCTPPKISHVRLRGGWREWEGGEGGENIPSAFVVRVERACWLNPLLPQIAMWGITGMLAVEGPSFFGVWSFHSTCSILWNLWQKMTSIFSPTKRTYLYFFPEFWSANRSSAAPNHILFFWQKLFIWDPSCLM